MMHRASPRSDATNRQPRRGLQAMGRLRRWRAARVGSLMLALALALGALPANAVTVNGLFYGDGDDVTVNPPRNFGSHEGAWS